MGEFKCEDKFTLPENFRVLQEVPAIEDWIRTACNEPGSKCDFEWAKVYGSTHEEFCSFQQQLQQISAGTSRYDQIMEQGRREAAKVDERSAKEKLAIGKRTLHAKEFAAKNSGRITGTFEKQWGAAQARIKHLREERSKWVIGATQSWRTQFANLPTYRYYVGGSGVAYTELKPSITIMMNGIDPSTQLLVKVWGHHEGINEPVDTGILKTFDTPETATAWLNANFDKIPTIMADCKQRWRLQEGSPTDAVCWNEYVQTPFDQR